MRLTGKKILLKLKKKNTGNLKLSDAIDKLITDIEYFDALRLIRDIRLDADCVHSDGFYFFNIHIHRTLILIEWEEDEDATIVWAGSHQEYERIFKNNRSTIAKWLRDKEYIY